MDGIDRGALPQLQTIGDVMVYRLGVDVGGKFTDLLLFDEQSGTFWRHKAPSTPNDSSEDVLNGVTATCSAAEVTPGRIEFFLHGTAVATNPMIEGALRYGVVLVEGVVDQAANCLAETGRPAPRQPQWLHAEAA